MTPEAPRAAPRSRAPSGGRAVVLVIEDEPPIRRFLRPILTSQGYLCLLLTPSALSTLTFGRPDR